MRESPERALDGVPHGGAAMDSPTKLVIIIPCYNEEAMLPETLRDLPRAIDGIDEIETIVIDDGSSDGTTRLARRLGVDRVIRFRRNQGLAAAFSTGIDEALRRGATVIVNTDADNQYRGQDIPRLIGPILRGEADLVVGDRQVRNHPEFSGVKKVLQRIGSWVVRRLSRTRIPDATSGFRAYSREAALRLNVISRFSYTLETLIQAGIERFAIASVPVSINPKRRESRLFRSNLGYIRASINTMLRIHLLYRPLRTFFIPGALGILGGAVLGLRFLYYYLSEGGYGHIQSLILATILILGGSAVVLAGFLADLIAANRRLVERVLVKLRKLELERTPDPDPEISRRVFEVETIATDR